MRMNDKRYSYTDAEIERSVIEPGGGLSAFQLTVCPDYKTIKWLRDGEVLDLIIEDNDLYEATINYLERASVPQKPWNE